MLCVYLEFAESEWWSVGRFLWKRRIDGAVSSASFDEHRSV